MTSTARPRAGATIDLGHPVRAFVLVLVGLAVGLVALQASGAVMPRVTNFEGRGAGSAVEGQAQWEAVVIQNDALLPVRVQSLRWPTANATDVQVDVLPKGVEVPGGLRAPTSTPATPFTLEPGEKRVVVLTGETTCPAFDTRELHLLVRTAVGIERDVVVDGTGATTDPCPDGG